MDEYIAAKEGRIGGARLRLRGAVGPGQSGTFRRRSLPPGMRTVVVLHDVRVTRQNEIDGHYGLLRSQFEGRRCTSAHRCARVFRKKRTRESGRQERQNDEEGRKQSD